MIFKVSINRWETWGRWIELIFDPYKVEEKVFADLILVFLAALPSFFSNEKHIFEKFFDKSNSHVLKETHVCNTFQENCAFMNDAIENWEVSDKQDAVKEYYVEALFGPFTNNFILTNSSFMNCFFLHKNVSIFHILKFWKKCISIF